MNNPFRAKGNHKDHRPSATAVRASIDPAYAPGMKRTDICLLLILALFTVIRVGMFVKAPYYYLPGSGYDDSYLLNMSESIRSFNWLGGYNANTLIKGVSFPLFIAISNWICTPYPFAMGIYHVIAVVVFCAALKKVVKNNLVVALCYLWLLYSPVTFGLVAVRVYRNAILYPAVIHVLGCMLMVYFNRGERFVRQLPWMIWLGLSFAFFYYIREDSIWLLPMLIACLVICAVWNIWFSGSPRKRGLLRAVAFVVPIAVFLLSSAAYRLTNLSHYGVFAVNDRSSGPFAELAGNMIRVEDPDKTDRNIWISYNQFERIVDACPSLAANKDVFMTEYNGGVPGADAVGDLSVWALRQALSRLGYYENARKVADFCRQVNRELLDSVRNGTLHFDNAIHLTTQSRGMYPDEIPELLKNAIHNTYRMFTLEDKWIWVFEVGPRIADIPMMEAVTGVKTVWKAGTYRTISGWMVVTDNSVGEIWLRLLSPEGEILVDRQLLTERGDLQAAFPDYTHALMSGFAVQVDENYDADACVLQVYDENDALLWEFNLTAPYSGEDLIVNIDSDTTALYDLYYPYAKSYVNKATRLGNWMTAASKVINAVALAGWVLFVVLFIIKRTWQRFEPAIILTGFLLSAFILDFGVTLFDTWLHNEFFYSSGVVAMGQAIQALSAVYLFRLFEDWRAGRRAKPAEEADTNNT